MREGPHIFYTDGHSYQQIYFTGDTYSSINKETEDLNAEEVSISLKDVSVKVPLKKSFRQGEDRFDNVEKVVALGDLHGQFDAMVNLLEVQGVIDHKLQWIFGRNHLVFCGDVFDRGLGVTECLWFIYYLTHQAEAAGGKVHYLLGNHEIMALTGDYRYLNDAYFTISQLVRIRYKNWFSNDSILGRWIRHLNTAIKINNVLFVHAGISPINQYSIEEMNDQTRRFLNGEKKLEKVINDTSSPLWYRGYLMDWYKTGLIKRSELNQILNLHGVKSIVFAHTEVSEVKKLHGGQLLAVDVHLEEHNSQALLLDNHKAYRITTSGEQILL